MIAPPLPADEELRLATLESYDILDTEREQAYDDFTMLAAQICGTPMAMISLVDTDRQWFKSAIGIDDTETPRDQAFCAHAIVDNRTLIVGDATKDARFEDNPLVLGAPNIRFYAGAPLVTADGHGLGTLCVLDSVPRTLTPEQQRALEALSRQLMAHLELRRALITLRNAESAKKNFVAHVSHELRTPLTSIRGALALVLDGDPSLDADSRELLTAGYRNANRLLALVNDLLDLERVGSGELSVEKRECDLSGVLERAAETVKSIAADAGVILEMAPVAVQLRADPERLTQVVINLIANAVRFSPRGGKVTVAIEPFDGHVCITVDDHGPGVPLEFRDAIFEPFKQVTGSAAHKKGGTGLGLTISQAIVKAHAGKLTVSDAPGGGARFTVELPLRS
jgi:signal transduction histidine kinase